MKRIFDFVLASVGLLLLAIPLLLVRKVRREQGSPVFFTQVRPGITGCAFAFVFERKRAASFSC